MRHFKSMGFVLLSVLVFLQLLACLGLYELLTAAATLRMNERRWRYEASLYDAKKQLRAVEADIARYMPACTLSLIAPAYLGHQPTNWWREHGCHEYAGGVNYYIVLEHLGIDHCGVVDEDVIADYYRLTLFQEGLVLQSTLAKSSRRVLSCDGHSHGVTLGRQMERVLSQGI